MSPIFLRTALATALAACAAQAAAVTFNEAYQAALANDPAYRMSFYENESAKENRVLGRANLLPTLGASYSANRNRVDLEGKDLFGHDTLTHPRYISRSSVIQLRQPLFNLDGLARYRQGKVQTEASEAIFAAQGGDLVLRVAGAYLDALLASDGVALSTAQRDMYAEQAKANARLFQKGEGTRTDMLETAAKLDQAEAQLLEAQDNLTTSRNTLATIIGMDPGQLQSIDPNFRFAPLSPSSFEEWKAIAIANSEVIKSRVLSVEVARLEIQKARAGHAPRVDLVASYSKNDAETVNTYTQNSLNRAIGVQVNIPLYQGGQVSAMSRQAVAGYERAKADLQVQTDRITIELRKAHSTVVSSVARIQALDKAVKSAELLVTATDQSIKGGVRINLDLLNAQQQLTSVQRDLAQARYTYLMAMLRLRAAAGTLSAADVGTVAGFFR